MMKNYNLQELCLCYGFPCIAILCVSMLVSVKLSADFHGDLLVKAVSFAGCNLLLWLLYVTVFQNFPRELQSLFGRLSDSRGKERQSQASTSIPQAPIPITDTISPEHYQEVNLSYIRQQETEKAALTESVIAYATAVMPPFVCESELARLCRELRNWCGNPGYTPQEVRLKERLSTNDLGHFVYNIAERLGRSNGYNGAVRSRFVKSLFATALADVDTGSIRNFTKTSPCDKIHLDYPKSDDKSFHYPIGEKPA